MAEPRLLVIMGSGETSPTMVTLHQQVFARLGPAGGDVPAVLLDTPFGFQANADDIAAKAVDYFRVSVGREVSVASYRSQAAASADPLGAEQALDALRTARWAFAGPGSPTYALRTWAGTAVPAILTETLQTGGAVTFASAAALTLGLFTVPVYEIYKVGLEPIWHPGLDILGAMTGWRVAVIPHFDNTEGGNHDTRFCYLGEPRLQVLEQQLPDDSWVLGVDEHTALLLDLVAGSATVIGRGEVTVRRANRSAGIRANATLALEELPWVADQGLRSGPSTTRATEVVPLTPIEPSSTSATTLGEATTSREREFDSALTDRDIDAAVSAILNLDSDIVAWSRDTLQSDDVNRARAALRGMVVRLGQVARRGAADPRASAAPFVSALLDARDAARADRQFALADRLRAGLAAAGVAVRDTPAGSEWQLVDPAVIDN